METQWGPATRIFGRRQGGETGASPRRAGTVEPTRAAGKKTVARRVFAEKAAGPALRDCSLGHPAHAGGMLPRSRLARPPFPREHDPLEFPYRLSGAPALLPVFLERSTLQRQLFLKSAFSIDAVEVSAAVHFQDDGVGPIPIGIRSPFQGAPALAGVINTSILIIRPNG